MSLSSDLISQFIKSTTDKKETKKESTSYGTVVINGTETYVQMDGSEILTPVSTTTLVRDGDRVVVMIKNHSATITGNLTDPSTSLGSQSELAQEIEDEFVEVDTAIADTPISGASFAAAANPCVQESIIVGIATVKKPHTIPAHAPVFVVFLE